MAAPTHKTTIVRGKGTLGSRWDNPPAMKKGEDNSKDIKNLLSILVTIPGKPINMSYLLLNRVRPVVNMVSPIPTTANIVGSIMLSIVPILAPGLGLLKNPLRFSGGPESISGPGP